MNRIFLFLPIIIVPIHASWGKGEGESHGTKCQTGPPRLQSFSPGIWIDWKEKAVELDARVVLQRGLLELLACSPNTKEHESVLVVSGRPRDIHHALGLIGLSPGSPARYDETAEKWLAPTGQQLHLEMRYEDEAKTRSVPAVAWLKSPKKGKPPIRVDWVFAGSTTFADGRFGGDVEGTVVAVVDFESAVIAVAGLHTADNESLWLEANPETVPPVGTSCRLVISARERILSLILGKDGAWHLGEAVLSTNEIVRRYREWQSRGWDVSLRVAPAPGLPEEKQGAVISTLMRAGIPRSRIRVDSEPEQRRDGSDGRGRTPGETPPG